jgi:hypothetical protein
LILRHSVLQKGESSGEARLAPSRKLAVAEKALPESGIVGGLERSDKKQRSRGGPRPLY